MALCAPAMRLNPALMRASKCATAIPRTRKGAIRRGCAGRNCSGNFEDRKTQMRKLLAATIALMIAVALSSPYRGKTAAAPKTEDDFQLIKVADGVYAAIAKSGGLASGNAGFIIGDDGVLVFDTFFTPAAIEELIAEIQTLTKLPI